jgi:uncharacterized protein
MKNFNSINCKVVMVMSHYPNRFKIRVDSVTSMGIDIESELSVLLLDEDTPLEFIDPITVKVHASKVERSIAVKGTISVRAKAACARCLNELNYLVERDNFFAFVKIPHDENIDLTEQLREDIIVSLPIRLLCSDDCKGLCDVCGTNLNERTCECTHTEFIKESAFDGLDKLMDLKNKQDNEN